VLLLDVDHFKEVNDVHGHAAGDQLLRELARRLCSGVRPEDTVARFGGDEFAMILAGVADEMTVRRRLAEIVELFATPVELSTGPLDIAISLGAALYPAGGETADELLHSADIALYQAKSFGRRQACVFHPGLGDEIEARLGLLSDARAGLARGQFEVFYQPIVDLRTADVRALEALVRWHHPTRGLLTPAAFPPVLADPALAWEIGDFVIARSLRQLRKWLDAGAPACCIQVNVSASQLRRGDELVGRIMSLLRECGLTPDRLRLELLEGAFVGRQAEAVAHTLKLLKSEGVVIALDDFGTGYASLTHIKQFDVGRIKIDRSFIAGVCNAASDAAITRAIIDLGRNLNIRVTAEGVEEPAQLAFLMAAGCDCGQGYLFGRPMPAADLPAWLAEWCGGRGAAILAGGLAATATRLAI
jgi:diguanylate cyclase (GGDEF)-like protein